MNRIAVITISRHEKRVIKQQKDMDIENFPPLNKEYHCWGEREKLVSILLIPSYVFLKLLPEQYHRIYDVVGIV